MLVKMAEVDPERSFRMSKLYAILLGLMITLIFDRYN